MDARRALRQRAAALILLLSTFVCSGCRQSPDLSAIVAFSTSVAGVQESFAALADDLRGSCIRAVGWQRAAAPDELLDAFSACSEDARASQQWQAANDIVIAYVAALGSLAKDSGDKGDFGLSGFADTFAKLGPTKAFSTTQRDAVSTAATSLLKTYFMAKRREDLGPILIGADASLASVTATLEDVARTNYVTQLTSERLSVQLFFEPNIARAKPGIESLEAFRYRNIEHDVQVEIDKRQGAVTPYVEVLENIRTTHGQLVAAARTNRFSDFASIVSGYVASCEPQIYALRKAFS